MIRLHPCLLFAGTCLILLVGYYASTIFLGQQFYTADHQLYFEPLAKYIGNAFREFRLPLWNPYIHCGMSQAATPSPGVFYPPNGLFAFLSYGHSVTWLFIFHQLIAGVGAYLLVSSCGWGAWSASVAGFIAAFSGYMFSLSPNFTLAFTAAWLPMSLWSFRSIRLCNNRRKLYLLVALAGITVFMIAAAGRPEIGAPALALVVAFVLLEPRMVKDEEPPANSAWQYLALLTGALLAMAVILPAAEWFFVSPRAHGLETSYVFLWSANWYDLLAIVFAQPFGDLTEIGAPYLNAAASRPGFVPFLPSALVGPVAITLAIWGISDKSWRARNWTLLIFLGGLVMVLGQNLAFVPKLIELIPGASIFRYPIKLIIFPILCIALAAARGMYRAVTGKLSDKLLLLTLALWVISLSIGTAFGIAGMVRKPFLLPGLCGLPGAQLLLSQALLRGSFIGLAVCGITYLISKKENFANAGKLALVALLAGSLFFPACYYHPPTTKESYYSNRPYLLSKFDELNKSGDHASEQRLLVLYFDPLKPPTNDFPGDPNNKTYNYFQYYHDVLLPNSNIDWLLPETFGYEAAETNDYREWFTAVFYKALPAVKHSTDSASIKDDLPLWKFCRSTATVWLGTQIDSYAGPVPKLDGRFFDLVLETAPMNLRIYRMRAPMPRAFICKQWSWVDSHKKALAAVTEPTSSGFDPETGALIERMRGNTSAFLAPMPPEQKTKLVSSTNLPVVTQQGVFFPSKNVPVVEPKLQLPVFLKDLPEQISISANLSEPSFLILADQYYPGWKAYVDGVATPIYRANGTFRAVYVPQGGHLIQFEFVPDSVLAGLCLAASGVFVILCLLWAAALPTIWRWLKLMSGEA